MIEEMRRAAMVLGIFAIVGTILVAISFAVTEERIDYNKRAVLLKSLNQVIGPQEHDNALFDDVTQVYAPAALGSDAPVNVYRARLGGKPVGAIIQSVAPDGYSGRIVLLVGIYYDGTIAGVRAVEHRETPGLGDAIDTRKSDWVHGFDGKSSGNPEPEHWKVKRDGGEFDQLTGATITPRAIVKAVRKTLDYFNANRDKLFAPLAAEPAPH